MLRQNKRMPMLENLSMILIVFLGVSMMSFLLMSFSPIDQSEAIAYKINLNPTQDQINRIKVKYGYDKPLYSQYFVWLKNIAGGDFGISTTTGRHVLEDIKDKLPATLIIVLTAVLWIVLISVPIAVLCVRYQNSIVDHLVRIMSIISMSVPTFWLGLLLMIVFAIKLSLFKVVDYGSFKSTLLPSITIALPIANQLIRVLRVNLISELNKEYIVYLRARGIKSSKIYAHALKNALPPAITLLFQSFGYMIAGSAIVETVFSCPGLGAHLVLAVMGRDIMTINGCVILLAVIFVSSNFVADIISHKLNPQLKFGGGYHD